MINKSSKKGASTLFLAIILSSLILVECTYVILVANLDRKLAFNRAVYHQSEVILASYDRELFRTYGIYAFDRNTVDDAVFRRTLEANGLDSSDATLVVSGMNSWNTNDLRKAITVYYSYRSAAITADTLIGMFSGFISQADELGVLDKISDFMSSDAASYLEDIIDGSTEVADAIASLAESFHIDNLSGKIRRFTNLMDDLDDLWGTSLDGNRSFDPSDMGFVSDSINNIEDFMNFGSDVNDIFFHPFLVHYSAYNFDSKLTDDKTIDGLDFSEIHAENQCDAEFLLTGLGNTGSAVIINSLIYSVLFVRALINVYTDPETMTIVAGIAEILDAIVVILSLGTVTIPPEVYQAVIACFMAATGAGIDLLCVNQGETVSFVEYEGVSFLDVGYRDFLYVFMNFVPDTTLLNRIDTVLTRDYPDLATEMYLTASMGGNEFNLYRGYVLYED